MNLKLYDAAFENVPEKHLGVATGRLSYKEIGKCPETRREWY